MHSESFSDHVGERRKRHLRPARGRIRTPLLSSAEVDQCTGARVCFNCGNLQQEATASRGVKPGDAGAAVRLYEGMRLRPVAGRPRGDLGWGSRIWQAKKLLDGVCHGAGIVELN
jgi:hypothetical protein